MGKLLDVFFTTAVIVLVLVVAINLALSFVSLFL